MKTLLAIVAALVTLHSMGAPAVHAQQRGETATI